MDTAEEARSGSIGDRAPGGVVDGTSGGVVAERLRARGPVLAGLAAWVIAYAVMVMVIVGLGVWLNYTLLPAGLDRFDLSVSRWFVEQRTPTLNTITLVGSEFGSTGAIVGVAAVTVVILAVNRYWYDIVFVIGAIALEFAVFLTATLLIDRNRPDVPRLDPSPVTSSYPSGHAAASLTLSVAVAIVIASHVRSAVLRTLVWVVAFAVPFLVGFSRVYRGMHHLTDVTVSALLAFGALLFALLVTRTAAAASAEPVDRDVPEPADHPALEVAS
jgi:membrane-associated phospholipid phosphatase